jgi:hypothetical protein
MLTRRNLAVVGVSAATAASILSSCTQQQVDDTAKKIAEVITAIQKGVKEGCATAGTVIPTANSVLSVIGAMFGAISPAVLTGVQIALVVTAIVEQACASTGDASGTRRRSASTVVKGVTVEFY